MPLELLPKTGFVIEGADSAEYCAGFLYKTDSKWALLEFVIGNPDVDKLERAEAVRKLIEELLSEAKSAGFACVFSTIDPSKNPRLAQTYLDTGFQITEVATQGIWRLN